VDTRLSQNESELGVLVLAVALQMLADSDGSLDHVEQVLWQVRGEALGLEHAQNLVSGDEAHLGNTVRVPQDDTLTHTHTEVSRERGRAAAVWHLPIWDGVRPFLASL